MVVSGQRSQAEQPTSTGRCAAWRLQNLGVSGRRAALTGAKGAPGPRSPRHSRSDPLFPPRFPETRATRAAAEGKRCALRGRSGSGAGSPAGRSRDSGGSWRLLCAPGAPGRARLVRARQPAARPGLTFRSAAAWRLPCRCFSPPGELRFWGLQCARTTLPSGGGRNAPLVPPPRLLPWATWHSQAARACPERSTPGCRPDELPAFALLGSPIPVGKRTGRGSVGPREGFSVPKGPASRAPGFN